MIAIGFFDGVHIGHAALLRAARRMADRLSCRAAAASFDRHPSALTRGEPTPLLSTPETRAALMRALYGIDDVIFSHFDHAMMEQPWQDYVREYLVKTLGAVHIICGHNHRFGYRGEGTPARLQSLCAELGIGCEIVPQVTHGGTPVSSTHIRSLIAAGDMEQANKFLGHPHCLAGTVVHGQQLGRTLGTPTANLLLPEGILPPAFGVYASKVYVNEGAYIAVTNIGIRPTVGELTQITVEPWILDFEGDLYGRELRVDFYKFLRPEQRFHSLDELKCAILENAAQTREYFQSQAAHF